MTRKDLLKLENIEEYPSISIFVPTHRNMPEKMQDPIKLKDLVGKATEKLLAEFDKKDVVNLIKNLDNIVSKIDFTTVLNGLAIFVNNNMGEIFNLPFPIEEKVIINKRFAIKQLLNAFHRHPNYWILSLSKKPTRLFKALGSSIEEVIDSKELQEKQEGFPFELNYEVTSDKKWEAVSEGDLSARYFTDLDKHFYNLIDHLLTKHINQEQLPVIVLGLEENKGIFEKITKNKNQIVGYKIGEFNKASYDEILKTASSVMQDYLDQEEKTAINLFKEAIGSKQHAFGIKDVWNVIQEGRARIILIEKDFKALGTLNTENPNNIILQEDMQLPVANAAQDLIDDLVDLAINKKTKIVFVQPNTLKEYGHIAAILRY